jgi:hypothetical protein
MAATTSGFQLQQYPQNVNGRQDVSLPIRFPISILGSRAIFYLSIIICELREGLATPVLMLSGVNIGAL